VLRRMDARVLPPKRAGDFEEAAELLKSTVLLDVQTLEAADHFLEDRNLVLLSKLQRSVTLNQRHHTFMTAP
jgi:hypothetical protein